MEQKVYKLEELFKNSEEIEKIKEEGSILVTEGNQKFELKLIKKEELSHEEKLRKKTRRLLEKYDEAMEELAKWLKLQLKMY